MTDIAGIVAGIVGVVVAQPEHRYWHDLPERRPLFAHRDEAVSAIVPVLRHAEPKVRRYFARLLRDLDRDRARELLRPLLDDPDEDTRLEACGALVGDPAWATGSPPPPFPVDDGDRAALARAARSLFESRKLYAFAAALRFSELAGDRDLSARLVARLPAVDWNVANVIFAALGRTEDGRACLVDLVDHADASTRSSACTSLGHAKDRLDAALRDRAIARLLVRVDDAVADVRTSAALSLARLGAREAEPHLVALARRDPGLTMLQALAEIGTEEATRIVRDHARSPGELRLRALRLLGDVAPSDENERVLLEALASDADPHVKKAACDALAIVGTARAVPAIERFLAVDAKRLTKRARKDAMRSLPAALEILRRRTASERSS
jgi:HEAT repeat protein